jgi:putative nucleotidyltransferase with HDIG domain
MSDSQRAQPADEMVRRLAAALRGARLYAPTHPLVGRNITAFNEALNLILAHLPTVTIGFVGEETIVAETPLTKSSDTMAGAMRRLRDRGVERIAITRGASLDEVTDLVHLLSGARMGTDNDDQPSGNILQWFELHADRFPHITIGGLRIEKRIDTPASDMVAVRQVYGEAVSAAETLWKGVQAENLADPNAARSVVNEIAQTVSHNRTALLALTALKTYDNYTFTHMVNVSILSMAQAKTLGIDGALLREIGLAALMHDVGKVRTPDEILNKPEKLTDEEFAIIRRHPVDGAAILRRTTDIPPLAPLVAFEHHLRLDGSGYPYGVARPTLNLGTQLCTIADVYDAMRSQRRYQEAFATDRILSVLKSVDHTRFDRHLVRRFVQLLGIYPPGNLVRLNTGEIGVVLRAHAPDPYRPRVRVLFAPDGSRYEPAYPVNLWEVEPNPAQASSVVAPVDPAGFQIDPLACM